MAEINYVTPTGVSAIPSMKRMSWGAIFAGAFCGLAIAVTLDALGMGVLGISANHAGGLTHGLTLGAGIWLIVASLISFFVGGWVSGRMAGIPFPNSGAIHGLTVWALAVVGIGMMAGLLTMGTLQTAATTTSNVATSSMTGSTTPIADLNQKVQQKAQQMQNDGTAQKAEMGASLAGFGLFIGLALTCIFSMLGGAAGAPKALAAPVAIAPVAPPVVEEPVIRREEPPRRVA